MEERRGVNAYGVPATGSVNAENSQLINKRPKLCENPEATKLFLEEEDRLSALPVSLLLHILSFLGTKDIAKTGVLSRRWQYLWTDLSEFDFRDYNLEIGRIRGFVNWVSKSLAICSGNYLKKFKVMFYYHDCFASSVNAWIQFVIQNKLKDVSLSLHSNNKDFYKLPPLMYSNSSFTNLSLERCIIAPPGTIEWKSLTSLSIAQAELSQTVMGVILSGCPVLRTLRLTYCWGSRFFDINTRSLTVLVIDNWIDNSAMPLLAICAPYIRDLLLTGDFTRTKCPNFRLIGSSSLVRAYLGFFGNLSPSSYREASVDNVTNYVRALLGNLKDVEELVLSARCGESFSGIPCLLESSPDLETLSIHWRSHEPHKGHAAFALNCDLLKLKTVRFTNFGGPYAAGDAILKLVQLLLKRAKILEQMVIGVNERTRSSSSTRNSSDYLKIAETVLSYPRSSPKAMVQLSFNTLYFSLETFESIFFPSTSHERFHRPALQLQSLYTPDFTNLFSGKKPNDIVLSLDDGQAIHDVFSRRSFVLRIKKKDKPGILKPYLQHVHTVPDDIEQRRKELKIHHHSNGKWKSVLFKSPCQLRLTVLSRYIEETKILSMAYAMLEGRNTTEQWIAFSHSSFPRFFFPLLLMFVSFAVTLPLPLLHRPAEPTAATSLFFSSFSLNLSSSVPAVPWPGNRRNGRVTQRLRKSAMLMPNIISQDCSSLIVAIIHNLCSSIVACLILVYHLHLRDCFPYHKETDKRRGLNNKERSSPARPDTRDRRLQGKNGSRNLTAKDIDAKPSSDKLDANTLLFLRILSFLDTKDVVRTNLLSRKFRYLWSEALELNFSHRNQEYEESRRFALWISSTALSVCNATDFKKFTLKFHYRRFKLDFYVLPQEMFFDSSLTNLSLRGCIINPVRFVEWKFLTSLSIAQMKSTKSVMNYITLGCPGLKYLELIECSGSASLVFCGPLKQLVLRNWSLSGAGD
ncbi:hypothetical protein BUALT_Bualt12G0012200 [Buddleja alternifolia]|uniref:F-box domain-containing protein n=1 Tax=Buddleja alternifolia TaxID=168488 RepID=A0AAV6WW69_9LAMI|nr:hypothetical protein BUALT_Bualt12G0012200 [Buddleja alternifolia]